MRTLNQVHRTVRDRGHLSVGELQGRFTTLNIERTDLRHGVNDVSPWLESDIPMGYLHRVPQSDPRMEWLGSGTGSLMGKWESGKQN